MKRKKVVFGVVLFLLGGLSMTSCTKNDTTTVSLIGTEYYIDDIVSVIPDSLQSKFFAAFGGIPQGPVPPRIDFTPQDSTKKEASYVMAPKQRVASSLSEIEWPLDLPIPENNIYLKFSGQHNGIVAIDLNESPETLTDTVFIQGNGQNFVVYFIEDKEVEEFSARMKRAVIMKGRVTDAGLADFRYATIVLETEDESNQLAKPGSYYIYKDGDGIADRFDW